MITPNRFPIVAVLALAVTGVVAGNALAYIGPGAGMEYIGYFMALLAMMGAALLSFLMWPFYAFMRWWRGTKTPTATNEPSKEAPPTENSQSKPEAPGTTPSNTGVV